MLYELIRIFEAANSKFIKRDLSLIKDNVNERALCGTLAQHITSEVQTTKFAAYYVDVEYNRNQGKIKTIIDNNNVEITINCDIILHSRGEIVQKDNLIAIEMKKSIACVTDKQNDKNRLIALTKDSYDNIWAFDGSNLPEHVCGYELGIYYEVNRLSKEIYMEYYNKGKMIANKTTGL